jgi:hypothetical protein
MFLHFVTIVNGRITQKKKQLYHKEMKVIILLGLLQLLKCEYVGNPQFIQKE